MIKLFSSLFYPIPSDYEEWLENLALKGWYPEKLNQWSSVIMAFEKKSPKKYRYILDLQPFCKSDYKKVYEEFGWEFCGRITNAYLWRMEYDEERPESFTDTQTLKERNNRFVKSLLFSFLFQVIVDLLITFIFFLYRGSFISSTFIEYLILLFLAYIYTVYLAVIIFKTYRKG